MDSSDASKIADIFLQLSSVYNEDAEVNQVVLELAGMSQVHQSKLTIVFVVKIFVGH